MCKCRLCDCCYLNCCKSFVGVGGFYLCFGYNCYSPLTNLMQESCQCCCCSWYCCRCVGCGYSNLGLSWLCCAPKEFDDPQAKSQMEEVKQRLKAQRLTAQAQVSAGVIPVNSASSIYRY